jgi:hypothetical protein
MDTSLMKPTWSLILVSFALLVGCGSNEPTITGPEDVSGDADRTTDAGGRTESDAGSGAEDAASDGTHSSDTGDGTDAADPSETGGEPDATTDPDSCAPARAFDEGVVYSRTLYVDPAASGGDGSAASPFGSLLNALQAASPGTDVVLRAGDYPRTYINGLEGTAAQPIRIRGEQGAVLRGRTGLQISNGRYVVLQDLVVDGATENGINLDDGGDYTTPAADIVIRNVVVRNVGTGGNQDCIKMSGVDRFYIDGVSTSQCSGRGIDMVGCHDGIITRSNFVDTLSGIQAKGGSADILIVANRFTRVSERGVNAGGQTNLAVFRPLDAPFEGARIHVHANLFEDGGGAAGAPIAFVGCDGCTFIHNTVLRQRDWIVRILQESVDPDRFVPSRNGIVANNIFVFNINDLRSSYINIGGNTAPETFRFTHNLWHALDTNFTGPNLRSVPPETNTVYGPIDFLDEDYRIGPDSPAAGAGTAEFAAAGDWSGRCWENPPSIGAHAP